MMADDGWRFCRLGQQLERAVITANAPLACAKAFTGPADQPARLGHHTEIELSAFLRLLGTRDAYRRVYQMRAEPLPVLKLLFQNAEAPRSVLHSLTACTELLRVTDPGEIPAAMPRPLVAFEAFCDRLRRIDWASYFEHPEPTVEDFLRRRCPSQPMPPSPTGRPPWSGAFDLAQPAFARHAGFAQQHRRRFSQSSGAHLEADPALSERARAPWSLRSPTSPTTATRTPPPRRTWKRGSPRRTCRRRPSAPAS